ncbi:hypothetical protein BC941DRAFT_420256 [Chlamydoabsidia padenii]|nr:hypothetical protein BC941DRAFT_420256 [Chlamydoabsidia padenii]
MSFNSGNAQATSNLVDTLTPENKLTRLEIDNAYLTQQNDHLQRELSFARYTISALKGITNQKDIALQDTKVELEKAYLRIKMLGMSMMRQQQDLIYQKQQQQDLLYEQQRDLLHCNQQQHYIQEQKYQQQQQQQQQAGLHHADEDKPMLIMDADSSDDQQELSDEEETIIPPRPLSSIMTKLPLRQHPTMVFENHHQRQQQELQQLSSPPSSPLNYNL